mgnify:CR=1 FL=1
MTKLYLLVSLALLVAIIVGALVFADAGLHLVDVSWNSHWMAGPNTWSG